MKANYTNTSTEDAVELKASPPQGDSYLAAEQRKRRQSTPLAAKDLGLAESKQQSLASDNVWRTPVEAAERARLSKAHFLRMVRKGRGPAYVGEGRLMRFRTSDVDAWVAGGCR